MINLNIIIRSLLRQKLNTGIIITSLAIGMACVNLIAMFIQRELNTDGFQKDADRIYAVKWNKSVDDEQSFICGVGAAEYMKNNYSQVEDFCRINQMHPEFVPKIVANNDSYFDHPIIVEASENFFIFFSYDLLTKNPKIALEAKNNIVISEELAHKYFGTTDAVGKVIYLVNNTHDREPMVVSGIFRKPLDNSQIKFDIVRLLPEGGNIGCYIKLKQSADPKELEEILMSNKNIPGIFGTPGSYHLKSLHDEYFTESKSLWRTYRISRDKNDLWIAIMIGLIIMGIAVINYLGLLNNSLLEKNKAYAIQRVNGGAKSGFVFNFMTENVLVVGVSLLLSFFMMIWFAPFFNGLTNTSITPAFVFRPKQVLTLCAIVLLLIMVTFLSVSLKIKTNIDLKVLKPGNIQFSKKIQNKAFTIFQLASTIILIITSSVIMKQTLFITNKSIGMDRSVIELKVRFPEGRGLQEFKEELLANPSITDVSTADGTPINIHFSRVLKFKENGVDKEFEVNLLQGDEHFFSTVGMQIMEGDNYSGNPSEDSYKVFVNESFARLFSGKNLIGTILPGLRLIDPDTRKPRELIIAGIVKDFQYSSLKSVIEPTIIIYSETGGHLLVKPSNNQITQAKQAIATLWKKHNPDYPLESETIGDQFELLHRENRKYLKLISSCCFISIFLSMIGLFAISFRNSQNRTKEIGIRKVNGAKINEILITLNKDFLKWLVIAFGIACPAAWYATHKWLESFAYKTDLSWWIFALAGLITLSIVLLTVSWQSWKAATRNPVEALRYE